MESVYGRFAVGTWLLSLTDAENRWAALFVRLLVVLLVGLVPFLGGLVKLIVLLLGLGALSLALYDRYGGRKRSHRLLQMSARLLTAQIIDLLRSAC